MHREITSKPLLGVCAAFGLVLALAGCPAPVIENVSPERVPASAPGAIAVVGRGFAEGATATFTSGVKGLSEAVPTEFVDATRLLVEGPVFELVEDTDFSLTIANPTAPARISNAVIVTYLVPPRIDSLSPAALRGSIVEEVLVTGQNFRNGGLYVWSLNGPTVGSGTILLDDAEHARIQSPLLTDLAASASLTLIVSNPEGQFARATAPVTAPPRIDSIAPEELRATVPTNVEIAGINIDGDASYEWLLDGAAVASGTVAQGDGGVTAAWPGVLGAEGDDAMALRLTNADGQFGTALAVLRAPPTVSTVVPSELPATISFTVTIEGRNFDNGSRATFIRESNGEEIGTVPAVFDADIETGITTLTLTSPPIIETLATPEAVRIVVTNPLPDGQVSEDVSALVKAIGRVTYFPPPSLDAPGTPNPDRMVVPSTLSVTAPGRSLTVTGANIRAGSIVSFIDEFDEVAAEVVADVPLPTDQRVSSVLTVEAPIFDGPNHARLVNDAELTIRVTDPQGQRPDTELAVLMTAPPFADSFVPNDVTASKENPFEIVGRNLSGGTSVAFFVVESDEPLGIIVPVYTENSPGPPVIGQLNGANPARTGLSSPTPVRVTVTAADGQVSAPLDVVYVPGPSIDAVTNTFGNLTEVPAIFPTTVNILGTNFQNGATIEFRLPDGTLLTPRTASDSDAVFRSPTELSARTWPTATGQLATDTEITVVVTNPDGQSTLDASKRLGSIRYQAEPGIEGIASIPPEDPNDDFAGWIDSRIPATIPTIFTITGCNFATSNPFEAVAVFRRASGLVVESVALTVIGDGAVRGVSPTVENLPTDEVVTVSIVDAYGQPSAKVSESCFAITTILYSPQPILEGFETTFVNHLGETVSDADVAPATIAVPFSLTGSNFLAGATAVMRQFCGDADAPIATLDGLRIPLTILAPGEATGMTPTLPTLADTLTDVEIAIRNPDGQTNAAAYCGIKFNAPPRVTGIVIAGTDDRAIIANGPFRNDLTGLNGPAVTLEISGENLDSRSPTSGNGALGVDFSGGALAFDGVGGVGGQARIVDSSAAATELGDNEHGRLANVFGFVDVARLIDYTGQSSTAGLRDALLTVFGPSAPNEGNAATLVSGDLNGDGRDDLVDVGVSATGIVVYVWYGREGEWRIPPDATRRPGTIGLGVTTAGAQHAAIGDFNGDDYDDLAIGVGDADLLTGETGPSSGAVIVYLGGPNGIGRVFNRQILGASAVPGATSGEGFGTALAAGDWNGDGLDELAVGAPLQESGAVSGVVYVFRGAENAFPSDVADVVLAPRGSDTGGARFSFGASVEFGDWNGDGLDELFVGSPGADLQPGQNDAGRVDVYLGSANADDTSDTSITGDVAGQNSAFPLAGDLDGDGIADLIVGAPNLGPSFTGGTGAGSARVYLGSRTVLPDPVSDAVFTSNVSHDAAGSRASMRVVPSGRLLLGSPFSRGIGARAFIRAYSWDTGSFFERSGPPSGIGFTGDGELFGAAVEAVGVTRGGEAATDYFVSIRDGIGGMRDGFLMIAPGAQTSGR